MKGGIVIKKPLVIVLVVILILAIILGIVFVSLNKEKTSISANDFKSSMQGKGYIIQDATSQFSSYDYIEQVYLAISNEYSYQIEFYVLSDEAYATSFYNNNKSNFESSKGDVAAETNASLKNYSKYTLSSNNKYSVVSRIDNTVIYLNVDSSYKDTVKDLLDELGY